MNCRLLLLATFCTPHFLTYLQEGTTAREGFHQPLGRRRESPKRSQGSGMLLFMAVVTGAATQPLCPRGCICSACCLRGIRTAMAAQGQGAARSEATFPQNPFREEPATLGWCCCKESPSQNPNPVPYTSTHQGRFPQSSLDVARAPVPCKPFNVWHDSRG